MIRIITISISLIYLQLILSCSVENPKNSMSKMNENSFRGKVISLDSNNSTVRVEVLARSNDLAPKFPDGIGSEHTMQVQPGDFALLSKKPIFRGKLQ